MASARTCFKILDVLWPDFVVPNRLSMNVEKMHLDRFFLQCFLIKKEVNRSGLHDCIVQPQSHLIVWGGDCKLAFGILRVPIV